MIESQQAARAVKSLPAARDYLIVDCHMHLYPTAEAGRAAHTMPYTFDPEFDGKSTGTIEEALEVMGRGNIARAFIMPIMPVMMMRYKRISGLSRELSEEERRKAIADIDRMLVDRVQRQNRWSCGVARENPKFVPYVTVDPIMGPELMRQELREMVTRHGARGIGELVPDMLGWTVDGLNANDPALYPIWETAVELNLPVHPHFGPSHPHPVTGKVCRNDEAEFYDDVLARFPRLRLIELHMNTTWDTRWMELYKPSREAGIAFAKRHPNVICDISGNLGYGTPIADLVDLIRQVGAERVIWGSDYMWVNPVKEIETILKSDLTEREKRLVLGENAVRFFDLKI